MWLEDYTRELLDLEYKKRRKKISGNLEEVNKLINACLKFLKGIETFDNQEVSKHYYAYISGRNKKNILLHNSLTNVFIAYGNTCLTFFVKNKNIPMTDPVDFAFSTYKEEVEVKPGEIVARLVWLTLDGRRKGLTGHAEDEKIKKTFKKLLSENRLAKERWKAKACFDG